MRRRCATRCPRPRLDLYAMRCPRPQRLSCGAAARLWPEARCASGHNRLSTRGATPGPPPPPAVLRLAPSGEGARRTPAWAVGGSTRRTPVRAVGNRSPYFGTGRRGADLETVLVSRAIRPCRPIAGVAAVAGGMVAAGEPAALPGQRHLPWRPGAPLPGQVPLHPGTRPGRIRGDGARAPGGGGQNAGKVPRHPGA